MTKTTKSPHTLSFFVVVLMNINITLGTGMFINTVVLSKYAGAVGGLTYAFVGLWLLPLVLTFTNILRIYPIGGMYAFGKEGFSPFVGFISAWTYGLGKLAAASLAIHVAISLLQTIIPILQPIPTLVLDFGIIGLYTLLNLLNVKQGSRIQAVFTALKLTPIFLIICSGLFLLNPGNFTGAHLSWSGLSSTIPLGLFTFYGFEAACNVALLMKNPEKNASRVVIVSHLIATFITTIYQLFFYGILGSTLTQQASFLGAYPAFVTSQITSYAPIADKLIAFLHIAIASSALGASYGVMYSNAWNFFTLAKYKHTFFSSLFSRLSKNNIAIGCVVAEACLCGMYLLVSGGNQMFLQLIVVLAMTLSFLITSLAYLVITCRKSLSQIVPTLSVGICLILLSVCIKNFFAFKLILPFAYYLILMIFGAAMYGLTRNNTSQAIEPQA